MYWVLRWGQVNVVRAFLGSPYKAVYWESGMEPQAFEEVSCPGVLWGDRVEIPTVEVE